jgi:hypothetical protein
MAGVSKNGEISSMLANIGNGTSGTLFALPNSPVVNECSGIDTNSWDQDQPLLYMLWAASEMVIQSIHIKLRDRLEFAALHRWQGRSSEH